jgi:hypothetical protein
MILYQKMGYENQNHDTNKANLRLWFMLVRGIELSNFLYCSIAVSQNHTTLQVIVIFLKLNIKKKLRIKVWL